MPGLALQGKMDKLASAQSEAPSNPRTGHSESSPLLPEPEPKNVSQYHRWSLPHRLSAFRVDVDPCTRLSAAKLSLQSATHSSHWMSFATVRKVDGTASEEPNPNKPDKMWRLYHSRERRDSGPFALKQGRKGYESVTYMDINTVEEFKPKRDVRVWLVETSSTQGRLLINALDPRRYQQLSCSSLSPILVLEMLYRGTDNLRGYVREAVLPRMTNSSSAPAMPMEGHKSHLNALRIRPESYRTLESMYCFKQAAFNEVVKYWINFHIPQISLGVEDEDEGTGERLTIPCPRFNIAPHKPQRPSDIIRLSVWFDSLPLHTVQRIMHLICPETMDWSFSLDQDKDIDESIFRHFFWTRPNSDGTIPCEVAQHSVVVAFQAQWILSPQDMQRFTDCRYFPRHDPNIRYETNPLHSKERLWGKLWDVCVRRQCPWFVLTSYSGWCFGAFSRGWTKAFVSTVYPFDSTSPTVLECLLFWLISAMGLPGAWLIPEVPEPVLLLAPHFSIPGPHNVRMNVVPSESSWEGKSEEAASSAGCERALSLAISEVGLQIHTYPLRVPRPRIDTRSKISEWSRTVEPSDAFPLDGAPPSPVLSDFSTTSASTVKDVTKNGYYGDWLIPHGLENPPCIPFDP